MSTSLGQLLREARQSRDLTIEQVSRVTHIRRHHLEALEAGDLSALPSLTQARGFLRTYALHLGLNPDDLVHRLGTEAITNPAPVEDASPAEALTSELYKEIGESLHDRREALGLSLKEAESQTHLRRYYLEALEAGAMDRLPSPVQGRGMLKNYAAFLGLDPDPLLLKFAEALQAQLAYRRQGSLTSDPRRKSAWRRWLSGDLFFSSLILLGLILFVIWAVGRVSGVQTAREQAPTAPALIDILDPQPTASPTATMRPTSVQTGTAESGAVPDTASSPTVIPTLAISNDAPVQVYIVVTERTWMRVLVDDELQFEGRVIPGSAYPFSGRDRIQVLTASGSGLQVFHNQVDLGPMGLFGQIVERIYTADAVLIPTPIESPTPTPTETPETTATPTATVTPTP